jgi:hypothetical protein
MMILINQHYKARSPKWEEIHLESYFQ